MFSWDETRLKEVIILSRQEASVCNLTDGLKSCKCDLSSLILPQFRKTQDRKRNQTLDFRSLGSNKQGSN